MYGMVVSSLYKLLNSHKVFFLIILFLLLPVIGFLVGVHYEKQMLYGYALLLPTGVDPKSIGNRNTDSYAVKKNCPYYGLLDKNLYLPSYTVKQGDSLLGIATKQLGSSDKIKILVTLNQDRYKSLTVSSPFVEVGWKLFFPPSYLPSLSSDIHAFAGEYGKKNAGGTVNLYTPTVGTILTPDDVISPFGENITEGDCVVLITSMEPGTVKDRAVFLQKRLPTP